MEDEILADVAFIRKRNSRRGVLDDAAGIGSRAAWEARLRQAGFELRGHRLCRDTTAQ